MHIRDHNKLEIILDSIDKIEKYTLNFTNADEFNENTQAFDATMMNFMIIGEMVSKISDEFKNINPEIEWYKIKGLRNIAAHDYFGIDAEEVWQILQIKIPALKKFIKNLLHP